LNRRINPLGAVLALGLLLLGCRQEMAKVAAEIGAEEARPVDRPAIYIEDFQTQVTRGPAKLQEIHGQWGKMDRLDNIVDMKVLTIRFYDEKSTTGQVRLEATSGSGRLWMKARPKENIAQNDLVMGDTVNLRTSDGWLMRTPAMRYSSAEDTLRGDQGFIKQMKAAGRSDYIIGRGDGFDIKLARDRSTFESYREYGHPWSLNKSPKPEIQP
jgi:hypothetical protein